VGTSFFHFVTMTDGQTDGRKGLRNTVRCTIMQSHGKNWYDVKTDGHETVLSCRGKL